LAYLINTHIDAEKALYISAVQTSMERGLYMKWVEMHTESKSNLEAHQTGVFMLWHRMFLLGFENMLRSLSPEFECVTIPYWDYVTDNADFLAKKCTSIQSCSPLLQELGGSNNGMPGKYSQTLNYATVTGDLCVTSRPYRSFCQNANLKPNVSSTSVSSDGCDRCVLRGDSETGDWQSVTLPPEANFASILIQMFKPDRAPTSVKMASVYPSAIDFCYGVETGVHSTLQEYLLYMKWHEESNIVLS